MHPRRPGHQDHTCVSLQEAGLGHTVPDTWKGHTAVHGSLCLDPLSLGARMYSIAVLGTAAQPSEGEPRGGHALERRHTRGRSAAGAISENTPGSE